MHIGIVFKLFDNNSYNLHTCVSMQQERGGFMGGKTSNESKSKYNAKAYDRLSVSVKKGEKEIIASHASERGESLNGFINRAIKETMERDHAGKKE